MLELRKKYKSGSAAEIIRDAILSGEISGEISQNDFADSLGISRIPVREALISLEYQGLIERLSNQHVKIINLNEESIKNIFQDMSLLEIEVLKNLNDKKLQQLSLLKNQMDFHRELYKSVNSPLRMNFLKIITETYLSFLFERSYSENLNSVFENLQHSLKDKNILKASYIIYSEVLTSEFSRIINHVESKTS